MYEIKKQTMEHHLMPAVQHLALPELNVIGEQVNQGDIKGVCNNW